MESYLTLEERFVLKIIQESDSILPYFEAIEDLNWQKVIEFSAKHGIIQHLYWNLKMSATLELIPSDVASILKREYYKTATRNTLLFESLNNILNTLLQANVEVILLKGSFLAQSIYQNIGLRSMSDIDILVKKEDLATVSMSLLSMGFQPSAVFKLPYYEHHHLPMFSKDGVGVEVHWHIHAAIKRFNFDIRTFWANKQNILGYSNAYSFSHEHQLIHLALHLEEHLNHALWRWNWFLDIDLYITKFAALIDWNYFDKLLKHHKIEKPIHFILAILKSVFKTEIPLTINSTLSEKMVTDCLYPNVNRKRQMLTTMLKMNNLAVIFNILFPSKKSLQNRYGSYDMSLSKLYALHWSIIWKHSTQFLQKIK